MDPQLEILGAAHRQHAVALVAQVRQGVLFQREYDFARLLEMKTHALPWPDRQADVRNEAVVFRNRRFLVWRGKNLLQTCIIRLEQAGQVVAQPCLALAAQPVSIDFVYHFVFIGCLAEEPSG